MFDKERLHKDLDDLIPPQPRYCRITLSTLVVSCFAILMLSGWFLADLWAAIHR